jgi:hypothetical protein
MSDALQHECGIAHFLNRLNFTKRNMDPHFTDTKNVSPMEKQHNRGQDGAGSQV